MAFAILLSYVNPACSVDSIMYSGGGTPNMTGSITATVTSAGTPPYSWAWTKNGLPFATTQNLQYIGAGTYTVIATDSLGATATATQVITEPTPIVPNPTITPPTCSGGTGTIALAPSGGTSPYTYLWSDSTTGSTLTGVSGTYSVTITDHNGCGQSFTYTIPQTAPTVVEISRTDENGTIILTAEYNCDGGTVLWSTGDTTASIIAQPDTTYTVTLTCPVNDTNCTATASISTGDVDDSYYCCAISLLSDRVTDEFNGVSPCDCLNDILLIILIGVYERCNGNTNCLTSVQMDSIISKLNEICGCEGC